ncbi:MAG TPA: sialate O-acetylesterase, partial [Armatimonadota bacterium]|nr:sialate O-acetylesterase [Armatimonadota bacterium]
QSNMEMVVRSSRNSADEIANSANQNIRLFAVRKKVSTAPLSTLEGQWTACGPDTVGSFSAAGYFFGRELQKRLNVPVGLIHTSWGGTPAEAWTSHDFLLKDPDFQPILSRYKVPAGVDPVAAQKDYEKKLAEYDAKKYQVDPGNKGEGLGWAKTDFADANWQTAKLPGLWDASGSKMDIDGAVWYRKDIQLPNDWAGKSLTLSLGAIDDFDVTYFNGVKVGAIDEKTNEYWAYPRTYTIPAELVKPGRNVIAVRVFDHFGSGGFNGTVDQMTLALAGAATTKPLTLAGMWKMNVELAMKPVPAPTPVYTMNQNAPSTLYNGMLNPIIPFGIKGAIWYQGESNAGRSYQYRKLFPAMITSWRKAWGEGDFPFIFVQLANYMQRRDFPTESGWAELREAQTMTLATKNTGMAVIIDIGEGDNIHPKNKQDVGKRLELAAEHVAYNKKIVYSGPMYKSMEVDHNTIRLHFTSVGSGLMIKRWNGAERLLHCRAG